jgi:hypothetical protein
VSTIEEILERKSSCSCLENRDYGFCEVRVVTKDNMLLVLLLNSCFFILLIVLLFLYSFPAYYSLHYFPLSFFILECS